MTSKLKLVANVREAKVKPVGDRKLIPGVVYGNGFDAVSIWIDLLKLEKIYDEAGESTIVDLALEGGDKAGNHEVLIYDLQKEPISGKISHVDFYKIKRGEKLSTEVELNFIGESLAVKELAGTLIKGVESIEIRCLPKDLPEEITVDLSVLKTFDDHLAVKDLKLGEGVELISPSEDTLVASVAAPRTQAELEELDSQAEAVDASAVKAEKGGDEPADADDKAEKKDNK